MLKKTSVVYAKVAPPADKYEPESDAIIALIRYGARSDIEPFLTIQIQDSNPISIDNHSYLGYY